MSSLKEHLFKKLASAGENQGWWDSSGLLVALSGGGDSMALLSLLMAYYPGRIVAVHIEHGFRGESSLRDAQFVEDYCRSSGVPCFVKHVDVMAHRRRGESPEMAGRRIRYEFFGDICVLEGLPFIATGHNAGDAVETMVHHFFRGTGVAGLSGISGRRDNIVRPLINCTRDEIRQFLRESGIPWREDETNDENHYTRNRIRNELLPWVRSNINESADRVILGLAEESSRLSESLAKEAERLLPLFSRRHPTALAAWDTASIRRLSPIRLAGLIRAQAKLLSMPVLDRHRTEILCGLIRGVPGWRFQWSGDIELCGDSSLIGWIRRDDLKSPDEKEIFLVDKNHVSFRWGAWQLELELRRHNGESPMKNNIWSTVMPFSQNTCHIAISSVADFMTKNNFVPAELRPWWSAASTPIISFECENIYETWLPGVRNTVRNGYDYVIIAKVLPQLPEHQGGNCFESGRT